jgi:DNA-binding transcriptional MerR regulator
MLLAGDDTTRGDDDMTNDSYTIQTLEAATGIQRRTLRSWIRENLLPKPLGKGRRALYDVRHLVRARVVKQLRDQGKSLRAIRAQIKMLSEAELMTLLPREPRAVTAEGVPMPPPATTYPSVMWEVVPLMDGMMLMVDSRGRAGLRRIVEEIYRYYGGG